MNARDPIEVGRELFMYNASGTFFVADLFPDTGESGNPTLLTVFDGRLFFSANVIFG